MVLDGLLKAANTINENSNAEDIERLMIDRSEDLKISLEDKYRIITI